MIEILYILRYHIHTSYKGVFNVNRFKLNIFNKLIFISILCLFFCSRFILPVFASTTNLSVYAPSCILIDANSGKILYNKNANEKMFPASTTKIMTAILTLEHCNLNDVVTISHNAVFSIPSGYSIASLQEGEQFSVEQLLNVLLIPSANDAAVALAEHIAGSVEAFSDMMNQKASAIGCLNTHFVNPNGIHNENHYSTAYDLSLIGKYAMQFDTFRSIVSKTYYELPSLYAPGDRAFTTTNPLIKKNNSSSKFNYYYPYATGAKTGYTDAAKNCIVATSTKDDISLIAVVLHDETTEDGLSQRALDCKALFNYGFNNYSNVKLFEKNTVAKQIHVTGGTKDSADLDLLYNNDVYALLPNNYDLSLVDPNIKLTENISAPIAEGTVLGSITYNIDNSDYSCDLIASHTVHKSDLPKTAMELVLLILFLVIFANFLRFKKKRESQKSAKRKRKNSNRKHVENFYPTYK